MRIYADPEKNQTQNTVKSENPNAFSDQLTKPTEKEKLKDLHGKKKTQYIWDYYKLPIVASIIVLIVAIYSIYSHFHQKTPVLTVTCANINLPEDMKEKVTDQFLSEYLNMKTSKYEVAYDDNMLIDDGENSMDSQFSYVSRMKLIAYISAGQMDLIITDQYGFDSCSASGFLADLSEVLSADPELYEAVKDKLVMNSVIESDNADQVRADPNIEYAAELADYPLGFCLSDIPLFADEPLYHDLYIAFAINSEKTDACLQYFRYLFGLEPGNYELVTQ